MQSAFNFPMGSPTSTCKLTLEVGQDAELLIRNIAAMSMLGRPVESIVREMQSPKMFRNSARSAYSTPRKFGATWEQAEIDALVLLELPYENPELLARVISTFASKVQRSPNAVLYQLVRLGRVMKGDIDQLAAMEPQPFSMSVSGLLALCSSPERRF